MLVAFFAVFGLHNMLIDDLEITQLQYTAYGSLIWYDLASYKTGISQWLLVITFGNTDDLFIKSCPASA